jgi:4-carboxymuconolactone decarboxylase
MTSDGASQGSGIPLPADDELPADIAEVLANLPPLNVFRMVARLPASFRPFMQLGGSLLGYERIDARVRELAILRVAHVTQAPYEWTQHEQLGRNVGLTDAEIAAARSDDLAGLGPEEALVCRVADEITRDVRLSDETLSKLLVRYDSEQACSLILCVAYYNMVSRFLESTRVEIEPEELLEGQTPGQIAAGRRAREG